VFNTKRDKSNHETANTWNTIEARANGMNMGAQNFHKVSPKRSNKQARGEKKAKLVALKNYAQSPAKAFGGIPSGK